MTCPITDLPTDQCGCQQHHRPESTVLSVSQLERLAGHPLPAYRAIIRPEWRIPDPEPVMCDHRKDDLCGPCATILNGLVADLPHLVEELGYAMRKDTRFPPHGHRRGDTAHPDEAPIPWNPAAAQLLGEINRLTATRPNRHRLLYALSDLATRVHRIIDRPPDRIFTMCPTCRTEIQLDDTTTVICPTNGCPYAATWQQHQLDLLDANADALLTMNDLVLVLTRAGEPMSRDRINKMITRHGLPRERIANPKWREGRLVTEPQWTYRLGDVRDLQAQIDTRKAG